MQLRFQNGFTLVELLVAMTILIILSLIAYYYLENSAQSGRDAERLSEIKLFTDGLEAFHVYYGKYPCGDSNNAPSTGLFQNGTADGTGSSGFLEGCINGDTNNDGICDVATLCVGDPIYGLYTDGYINNDNLKDPLNSGGKLGQGGYRYVYFVTDDRQDYVILTRLENDTNRMENDGGVCPLLYEVGTAVGKPQYSIGSECPSS